MSCSPREYKALPESQMVAQPRSTRPRLAASRGGCLSPAPLLQRIPSPHRLPRSSSAPLILLAPPLFALPHLRSFLLPPFLPFPLCPASQAPPG